MPPTMFAISHGKRSRNDAPEIRFPATPASSSATPRDYFVDGPLTQARIALVFPLFVCLSMSISGLVGEWKAGAFVGMLLSILAAFGLSVGAGR